MISQTLRNLWLANTSRLNCTRNAIAMRLAAARKRRRWTEFPLTRATPARTSLGPKIKARYTTTLRTVGGSTVYPQWKTGKLDDPGKDGARRARIWGIAITAAATAMATIWARFGNTPHTT